MTMKRTLRLLLAIFLIVPFSAFAAWTDGEFLPQSDNVQFLRKVTSADLYDASNPAYGYQLVYQKTYNLLTQKGDAMPYPFNAISAGAQYRMKVTVPPGVAMVTLGVEAGAWYPGFYVGTYNDSRTTYGASNPAVSTDMTPVRQRLSTFLYPVGDAPRTAVTGPLPQYTYLIIDNSTATTNTSPISVTIYMRITNGDTYNAWIDAGRPGLTGGASGSSCTQTLSANAVNAAANDGQYSVTITSSTTTCAWSASTSTSWIHLGNNTSGTGTGTLFFTVDANTGTSSRTGTITIAGQTYTVTQAGVPACTSALSKYKVEAPAATGTHDVNITSTCGAWNPTVNEDDAKLWITIAPTTVSGTGTGKASLTVAANTGATPRKGTLTIAGQKLTVIQAAAAATACPVTLSSSTVYVLASGGPGSATITSSCGDWIAVSDDESWITVNTATGKDKDPPTFSVAANTGVPRTGTLTIVGQTFKTFTVTQAGGTTADCVFNWVEKTFSNAFTPSQVSKILSTNFGDHYYRDYSTTGKPLFLYVCQPGSMACTATGQMFYYYGPVYTPYEPAGSAPRVEPLGTLAAWASATQCQ